MLSRIFFLCLFVALNRADSSLSCDHGWKDKFRQCSENYLNLLDAMVNNSTNSTEDTEVSFPKDLYTQASKAPAVEKLVFTDQVLKEVLVLFEEDHSSASWEQRKVEDFLTVVHHQTHVLHRCIQRPKKNKKLHIYFKRLSHVLKRMGRSAESWELIRKQIQTLLLEVDLLLSPVLNTD